MAGFCRQCGQPAAATDRFCGHCGNKLSEIGPASAATTTDTSSQQDLLARLKSRLTALGLTVRDDGKQGLAGEVQPIRSKWWLGGRAVTYNMSCRPSEADRTVQFRESVSESSWGIPPPTASVEKTKVSGWKLSGERTDASPGGGGSISYAQVRDAVEQAVTAAGWKYQHQGGRMP